MAGSRCRAVRAAGPRPTAIDNPLSRGAQCRRAGRAEACCHAVTASLDLSPEVGGGWRFRPCSPDCWPCLRATGPDGRWQRTRPNLGADPRGHDWDVGQSPADTVRAPGADRCGCYTNSRRVGSRVPAATVREAGLRAASSESNAHSKPATSRRCAYAYPCASADASTNPYPLAPGAVLGFLSCRMLLPRAPTRLLALRVDRRQLEDAVCVPSLAARLRPTDPTIMHAVMVCRHDSPCRDTL